MRPARTARVAILALAAAALAACVRPATEVLVLVGTDVPAEVPLHLTVRVVRGGSVAPDAAPAEQRWTRRAPDAGPDAGIALPATFAVVPAARDPRDELVTLVIEADAGGVLLRRTARFAFVPHATLTLPVFLTARCAERAAGCAVPGECTRAQLCEERGQTCGNDGACVELPVALAPDGGASFGDATTYGGCGLYGQACCVVGDPCRAPLTCASGRCQRCTDPGEVCCTGGDLRPNGTACAMPLDPRCQNAGTCADGVCGAVTNRPDGTVCAMSSDPCVDPGVCRAGACQPSTPRMDGAACGPAPDACHDAPRCAGGRCGAPAVLPDGTPWGGGGLRRCCNGSPVSVNTAANCGACGLACAPGQPCTQLRGQPQWYCGCAANSECWSGCCVTFYGAPYACGASHCTTACIACPGGATCNASSTNPYYCAY